MGYQIVGRFSDRCKSGKDRKRDGLKSAMTTAIENKAVLVVRDFSRLTRDVRDALTIREELLVAGAGLADLETKIDTTGPLGKLMMTMKGAVDDYTRTMTGIKTSEMLLWKQKSGQSVSSKPPFGWRFDRKEPIAGKPGKFRTFMEADPDEQAVLVNIVEMRNSGKGVHKIAKCLNDEKVHCRGTEWHATTVARILKRIERDAQPEDARKPKRDGKLRFAENPKFSPRFKEKVAGA